MSNYDVLCIGDAKLDTFLTLTDTNGKCRFDPETKELCFKHGEKISVAHTNFSLGGNAANVAVGLTRLGLAATIAAEIGDDEFALKIVNMLAREHIDRGFINQTQHQESSMSVAINFKGDRTLFSEHVKRHHNFHYHDIKTSWIYLTSLGEEWVAPYERALRYVQEHTTLLACNPGTLQLAEKSQVMQKTLKLASILFVNKEEAQHLVKEYGNHETPSDQSEELLHQVASLGPKTVVITNGKYGSYALDSEKHYYHQEVFPSIIVERTGAGDAYASGFLAAIIHHVSIQEAMQWGSKNAASAVGQIGAQAGLLKKSEMKL